MPTQEERLSTLERNMTNLNGLISDISHNETILLGMAMRQGENIREIKLNLAALNERLSTFEQSVNSRFDEHTTILAQHTTVLNEHTTILAQHTTVLNEHTTVLNEHTTLLNQHTTILNQHTILLAQHTTILEEHTGRFDRIDTILAQILARLPEKP